MYAECELSLFTDRGASVLIGRSIFQGSPLHTPKNHGTYLHTPKPPGPSLLIHPKFWAEKLARGAKNSDPPFGPPKTAKIQKSNQWSFGLTKSKTPGINYDIWMIITSIIYKKIETILPTQFSQFSDSLIKIIAKIGHIWKNIQGKTS